MLFRSNDTATTEIYTGSYTLSLHDALPISFQALIFASLTLMYVLTAVESHHEEEHAAPPFASDPEGDVGPPLIDAAAAAH